MPEQFLSSASLTMTNPEDSTSFGDRHQLLPPLLRRHDRQVEQGKLAIFSRDPLKCAATCARRSHAPTDPEL